MKFSKWNIRRSDLIVGIILCFLLITGLIVFFVGRDRDQPLTMLQLSINPYEESSFYREGEFIRCTQAEKNSRYPRHRSYPRPGVSSLKGLLT